MTLGQFWMWGEGICAEKNSPENPVSILSPKNFSFYLISTGTIITNIISGDERSSFPVVVSYETTTHTCHTWPHHLRVMTSSRGVFKTCDRTRPGKQINFTEEGSNDIPWMGDEWLFTFQFEPKCLESMKGEPIITDNHGCLVFYWPKVRVPAQSI